MRPRLGKLIWALGAIASGACSKAMPMNTCADAGAQQHEDMVTVTRGSSGYASDVDQCAASGQCDALCDDLRGNPGDGTRVQIVTCTRTSIEKVDAAAPNDGGALEAADGGIGKDASTVLETSVSLDITYVVFPCPSAD
jgi:hypothetical protein